MGWFTKNNEQSNSIKSTSIKWITLKSIDQAKSYIEKSDVPVVFFKHSTSCSISAMMISRFEREWTFEEQELIPIYLDLIAHRDVSNFLATYFDVTHQSPQVLVIKNAKCIHNASHSAISISAIAARLALENSN
jgi:bacillithiol system protein YtxJ